MYKRPEEENFQLQTDYEVFLKKIFSQKMLRYDDVNNILARIGK